ncbi:hypothetical protein SCUCBS95973_004496 [Sporothrix curviconia]|uniref:Uncharacterized protein n=1 Tax=Sporothrix curviconia TaxID=1260050 RepID=A0ABP0BPH9_9PEZI
MATTERRKSISLFFGFGRQEPKGDALPDGYPKLRRKLQKVTKQVDSVDTDVTATGVTQAPAPDVGGVQTVKVPGDEAFLSTRYDASRPLHSRDVSTVTAPGEEKRSRRESKPRFFFRSSSTSRVPHASRSSSLTRTPTATATPALPAAAAVTTEHPVTATSKSCLASGYGLEALGDAQDKAQAQEKAAQAAAQARTVQMMEEHERISAQQRMSQSHGHAHSQSQRMPPSASRTKRMTVLPLTPGAPSQQQHGDKAAAARPYPQFHRPYSQSQHQPVHQPVFFPAPSEVDVRRALSTAAARPSYTSRKSTAGLAPVSVPTTPMSISPLSPTTSSSAMSDTSSGSPNSPASAAFNMSSASLALTAATSVNQSCSTLPASAHGLGSSCTASSSDGSVNSPFSYTLGRTKSAKFDFDNESAANGGSGSGSRRAVPELSYLSGSSSPDSSTTVSSVEALSATTKPRRKVKTPVYAVGQLESEAGAGETVEANANEQVELGLLQSKSSIECIAEEYRALLASRNSQSTEALSEVNMDVFPRSVTSYHGGLRSSNSTKHSSASLQAQAAALNAQRKFMLAPPGATKASNADARDDSPFLPAAMVQDWLPRTSMPVFNIQSPPPPPALSPLRTRSSMMGIHPHSTSNSIMEAYNKQRTPPPPPQPQSDNPGLQICVDLLTRELSSAVLHRSSPAAATAASQRAATRRHLQQNGSASVGIAPSPTIPMFAATPSPSPADNASSALQILVMIEAYERLRDQLVAEAQVKSKKNTRKSHHQASKDASTEEIEAMFGLWLKSLYRIHDSLTSDAVANGEDSYDDGEQDNTSNSDYDFAAESI